MRRMLYLIYFIYFFCGMTQCFESLFLPEFKQYFNLSYQQQMYTMFAKNVPFLLSMIVGAVIVRVGYKNCLTLAMMLYSLGTLLLVPALKLARYELILVAFSLIGSGFTVQMVSAGPLLSALGDAATASSRQNLGNALGAIAQIIAPVTLSVVIPVSAISVTQELPYMQGLFLILGVGLAMVAIATLSANKVNIHDDSQGTGPEDYIPRGVIWKARTVVLGFVTIFLVLGTEAALFGFFRNYLEDPSIAGLSSHQSQRLFTVYFALFALGRLLASWIQKSIRPATHMLINLCAASACLLVVVFAKGPAAVIAVVALGFFVSIFFPTLYAMAIESAGELVGQASGLLTLGFLGCAVIPLLQGRLADSIGLQKSYMAGLAGYIFAMFYVSRSFRRKATTE